MIFDNILIYFVIIPLLTLLGLALCQNKSIKAIRTVAVVGATALVVMAIYLVNYFLQQRGAGNTAEMLLVQEWTWYAPCLLYTSPSPRDVEESRMPSSA